MSVLIKASSNRAQAFNRGFWKGLGGLGAQTPVDSSSESVFEPQPLPSRNRGDTITDWQIVGLCMSEAMAIETPTTTNFPCT